MPDPSPKVTCFCPTRNRRDFLPAAIRSYQLQTYANKELLIIADGERVDDLIPKEDPGITLVHLTEAQRPILLADKFNLSCKLAKGQVLAKWDDDDWSAPHRLSEQVQLMYASGRAVVGYHSCLFTNGNEWYRYSIAAPFAIGTSLCFLKAWWQENLFTPQLPGVNVGSDVSFAYRARHAGQLISVDGGETMVASIHPSNTSARDLGASSYVKLLGFPGVPGYSWPLAQQEGLGGGRNGHEGAAVTVQKQKAQALGLAIPLRLNLGCSDTRVPGFVGVDVCEPADVVHDLGERWPWGDSTVDEIWAHDVFEHIDNEEFRGQRGIMWVMNEAHRVLKPGGRLDLVVPSLPGSAPWVDPSHVQVWTADTRYYFDERWNNPQGERGRLGPAYGITALFKTVGGRSGADWQPIQYAPAAPDRHKIMVTLEAVK